MVQTKKKMKIKNNLFYWSIVGLPLLHFLIFYIVVNFNSILLAFEEYSIDGTGAMTYEFVGFQNFRNFIRDLGSNATLIFATKNSLLVYFIKLIVGIPCALLFSYYIYKKFKCSGVFKVIIYIPSIISSVTMVIMFRYFVALGIPKGLETIFGITVESNITFGTVLFYGIWVGFGSSVLLYVGAMSGISPELIEVGKLEGLSAWGEFVKVILPLIYPTITTFLVVGVAGIFTDQAELYTFYGEGAEPTMYTFGYFLFQKVVNNTASIMDYPYASAGGLIFTCIAAPITLLAKFLLEKFGPSEE